MFFFPKMVSAILGSSFHTGVCANFIFFHNSMNLHLISFTPFGVIFSSHTINSPQLLTKVHAYIWTDTKLPSDASQTLYFACRAKILNSVPNWPHAYLLVDIIVRRFGCIWASDFAWESGRNTTLGNPPLSLWEVISCLTIPPQYMCVSAPPLCPSIPVFLVSLSLFF